GRSVKPSIDTRLPIERDVYSESLYPRLHFGWSDLASVTDQKHRYIRAPTPELYDVSTDPGERQNLAGSRAATLDKLARRLAQITAGAKSTEPGPIPADDRE